MKYKEIIENNLLQDFDKILVTGTFRSGTTIASKIISEDYDYRWIDYSRKLDHRDWKLKNHNRKDWKKVVDLFSSNERFILQAPSLTPELHHLVQNENSVLVIFMIRNIDDIINSFIRINKNIKLEQFNLNDEDYEVGKYRYKINPISLKEDLEAERVFNEIDKKTQVHMIQNMWKNFQKNKIKHSIDLEYESMKIHSKWVDVDYRLDFKVRQTEL